MPDQLIIECDTNKVSDGYHTFGELYEHRIELFITLCWMVHKEQHVWRSALHSDGTASPITCRIPDGTTRRSRRH